MLCSYHFNTDFFICHNESHVNQHLLHFRPQLLRLHASKIKSMPFPGWDIHLPALGFDKCDIARMDLQTGPGIPKSIITKLHRLLNPREHGVSLTVPASETVENETKPAFLTHARYYLSNLTLHVPQKTRKPPPLGPREGRANCRMFCRLLVQFQASLSMDRLVFSRPGRVRPPAVGPRSLQNKAGLGMEELDTTRE